MAADDPRRAPRRMGRPPLDEHAPSIDVNVKMPSWRYDALDRDARRDGVTLPEFIRRHLPYATKKSDR